MSKTQYYHLGRFTLSGGTLPDAFIAYRTYGDPCKPCIAFPTCYGGRLDGRGLLGNDYLIGEDKALDPSTYFIVSIALFSNGESSSPSNTAAPYNGFYFPMVTYEDNIRAQYRLLTEKLGVTKLFCVIGFSMGGQQAYHWPIMYPDFVERFICICGSARTSPHNKCFLEGPMAALTSSRDFHSGYYTSPPEVGIRAFARVYSAWAYGQTWYRNLGYLYGGRYTDLNDFILSEWEGGFLGVWDAHDMLTLMQTWWHGDVSRVSAVTPALQGDLASVLSSITAKALIMPCRTDLYFPPEDNELEVEAMKKGLTKLVIIPSIWGHMAGGGSNDEDNRLVTKEIRQFLQDSRFDFDAMKQSSEDDENVSTERLPT